MEFDKSKVYTAVNADELKVGSTIIVAENIYGLKKLVNNFNPKLGEKLEKVLGDDNTDRFVIKSKNLSYNLAYLIEEPKEPKKRPMTFEEIISYWKEHRTEIFYNAEEGSEGFITGYSEYRNNSIRFNGIWYVFGYVLDNFIKEDGSKFEVEE